MCFVLFVCNGLFVLFCVLLFIGVCECVSVVYVVDLCFVV